MSISSCSIQLVCIFGSYTYFTYFKPQTVNFTRYLISLRIPLAANIRNPLHAAYQAQSHMYNDLQYAHFKIWRIRSINFFHRNIIRRLTNGPISESHNKTADGVITWFYQLRVNPVRIHRSRCWQQNTPPSKSTQRSHSTCTQNTICFPTELFFFPPSYLFVMSYHLICYT